MPLCIQNLLVQFGEVPDHVPLARHWRVGNPVRKYPSIQEYTMELEKAVPSKRDIRPWAGVPGFPHCTATKKKGNREEEGQTYRTEKRHFCIQKSPYIIPLFSMILAIELY